MPLGTPGLPVQRIPETSENGKHCDLYLCTPGEDLHGYVDAPHAAPITEADAEKFVYTGYSNLEDNGDKSDPKLSDKQSAIIKNMHRGSFYFERKRIDHAERGVIYADGETRKSLGPGHTLTIKTKNGITRTFKIKQGGRIKKDESKWYPLITNPEDAADLKYGLENRWDGNKPPRRGVIYADGLMRRRLKPVVTRNDKLIWTWEGTEFEVRPGRHYKKNHKRYYPIITNPADKESVKRFLVKNKYSDRFTGEIAQKIHQMGASVIIGTTNRSYVDLNRYRNDGNPRFPAAQIEGIDEYRLYKAAVLKNAGILGEDAETITKPFLHIALHGKKDRPEPPGLKDSDIEIGTKKGKTCAPEKMKWFKRRLTALLKGEIERDGRTVIDESKAVKLPAKDRSGNPVRGRDGRDVKRDVDIKDDIFQEGDPSKEAGRRAHGADFNTIQLEVGTSIREKYQDRLAEILHQILVEFTAKKWGSEAGAETEEEGRPVHTTQEQTGRQTREIIAEGREMSVRIGKILKENWANKDWLAISRPFGNILGVKQGDKVKVTGKSGAPVELTVQIVEPGDIKKTFGSKAPIDDGFYLDGKTRGALGVDVFDTTTVKIKKV